MTVSGWENAFRSRFEVLMMVKGVASGPVHETDVGVDAFGAVVVVARSGVEEHIRDPSHRDELPDRVGAL